MAKKLSEEIMNYANEKDPMIGYAVKSLNLDLVMDRTEVSIEGITYAASPFSLEELIVFIKEFNTVIAPVSETVEISPDGMTVRYTPMSSVSAILRQKAAHILAGGMIAKKKIGGGLTFGGYYANVGTLGWRHIKPIDVLRTTSTTETPYDSWSMSYSAGNSNYIGYGTNRATTINIDKNICVVPVGIGNKTVHNQVVEQMKFKVGDNDFKPVMLDPLLHFRDSGNNVPVMSMKTMIFPPRGKVFAQARASTDGSNQIVLLGVTFGDGGYLTDLTRTSVEL
ncbi:MAG TPA: hypothetical protein EYP80_01915 [Candidatus Aenigmarchaeota archaeon]|nr:hypothetical protein [Candidatus Aenigmarchaeota archaeon]